MIRVNNIGIEVTRRCNMQCTHCMRGRAQNKDISLEYIDVLLDQISSIGHFCATGGEPSLNVPAIQYFIDGCKKRNISIFTSYIATNGLKIDDDFVDVCEQLNDITSAKCSIQVSNDVYHKKEGVYDDHLLKRLSFYSKRHKSDDDTLEDGRRMHYEGLATTNYPYARIRSSHRLVKTIDDFNHSVLYLNVEGNIIAGCDWSYEHQNLQILCRVNSLEKYYNIMNHIEEDWGRLPYLDKMYLLEKQKEIEEEWQLWLEQEDEKKKRLPAKINVKCYKENENVKKI